MGQAGDARLCNDAEGISFLLISVLFGFAPSGSNRIKLKGPCNPLPL